MVLVGVNLRERGHLEDPGIDGKTIIKLDLQEIGCGAWTELSWLRIGTGGVLLSMQ